MRILTLVLAIITRIVVVLLGYPTSIWANFADRHGLLFWPFLTEALGLIPFTFGCQFRGYVYRRLGVCRGEGTIIHVGTSIGERATTMGSDVWVSKSVYIEYAHIGDHTLIGPGAILLAGRRHHRTENLDVPIKLQGNNPLEPISIGEGAWIGANATIMADVGQHAIVGAGAVVIEPVPDYAIVAGNPARKIRDRRDALSPAVAAAAAIPGELSLS